MALKMTLRQKKTAIRRFVVKDMLPFLLECAYQLPDDATQERVQEMVAEKFAPYLNPPISTRSHKRRTP